MHQHLQCIKDASFKMKGMDISATLLNKPVKVNLRDLDKQLQQMDLGTRDSAFRVLKEEIVAGYQNIHSIMADVLHLVNQVLGTPVSFGGKSDLKVVSQLWATVENEQKSIQELTANNYAKSLLDRVESYGAQYENFLESLFSLRHIGPVSMDADFQREPTPDHVQKDEAREPDEIDTIEENTLGDILEGQENRNEVVQETGLPPETREFAMKAIQRVESRLLGRNHSGASIEDEVCNR